MGKLICLLGKSGAGKDTLFKKIVGDSSIGVIPIIPYTTRPKRANEIDGVHYHFVTKQDMDELERQNRIVEKREYLTVNGMWYYFTADLDVSKNEKFIIITTPYALKSLAERIGNDNIVTVLLDACDKVRLERSIARESKQAQPNYSEVCRRYLADEEDFSKVAFHQYFAHFTIDANMGINSCLEQFRHIYRDCF